MTEPEHVDVERADSTVICPECNPVPFLGTIWHPLTYQDMLCPEHRPPDAEWMPAMREETAARHAAHAAAVSETAALPVHPSRGCTTHHPDMPWCPICGWPETHHLPAATLTGLTGILNLTDALALPGVLPAVSRALRDETTP